MTSTGQGLPCGVPEYASAFMISFVCFLTEYIWIPRALAWVACRNLVKQSVEGGFQFSNETNELELQHPEQFDVKAP